ncbi:MAG: hypothetical protein ACI865_002145 [Flavobacteriaceae bacterium]|jgi:hypothetical protein
MTNNLSVLLKKYSVPALFLIIGMTLLIVGLRTGQGTSFMMSAVMMFAAGALSALYSSGKVKSTLLVVFGGLTGIAAFAALFMSTTAVRDTIAEQEHDELAFTTSTQNLADIRYVQKEHIKKTGEYLRTWDEFTKFVESGTIPFVVSEGSVPSRRITTEERDFLYDDNRAVDNKMTEDEAVLLSKWEENPLAADYQGFKRDTIQMDMYKSKFGTKAYLAKRDLLKMPTFYGDSLRFIPFSGNEEWLLEVTDSVEIGAEFKISTLRVSGIGPFGKKKEISFGSKNSGDLSGSWEND